MIVPMPTFLMDALIAFNISISLIVLVTALHAKAPLQLAVFPSLMPRVHITGAGAGSVDPRFWFDVKTFQPSSSGGDD